MRSILKYTQYCGRSPIVPCISPVYPAMFNSLSNYPKYFKLDHKLFQAGSNYLNQGYFTAVLRIAALASAAMAHMSSLDSQNVAQKGS